MIDIDRLTFGYASADPIFEGFSWGVSSGEAWCILGPSGCGKTTLLDLLGGLPPAPGGVGGGVERVGRDAGPRPSPGQLSGGQRQRTAIARTLALHPDLLLMDEPFGSLDAPTREALQDLPLQLRGEGGLTLILVTHTLEEGDFLG